MKYLLAQQEFDAGEAQSITYYGVDYFFDGIIYMLGAKAGEESVRKLARCYYETGELPFSDLYGSYHMAIRFLDGRILLFTDNSYQNVFFIGRDCIGNSFLETVRYEKGIAFNLEAVCEYLTIGDVYFQKTFFESIKLSSPQFYYVLENGTVTAYKKNLGEIDAGSKIINPVSFLREMSGSLLEMSIAQSLTGGFDSRMLYAVLHKHPRLITFLTGDNETTQEMRCAKKVALAGNHVLQLLAKEKPHINDILLRELLLAADGCTTFVEDGFIRMNIAMHAVKENGCDCYISGDGGVMHKDWWWLQDFPFYRRKRIDFSRFYDQRIEFIKKYIPLGDRLTRLYSTMKKRFIQELSDFKKELNTQTYDNLYFNVNGNKIAVLYNGCSRIIHSYAPLWEYELVRFSYNVKRSKRFFNMLMREVTTELSPQIAKEVTNYGTTASAEIKYITRDIVFQCVDYGRKYIRMIGRKLLRKSLFNELVLSWSIEKDVRALLLTEHAVEWSIDRGYIAKDTRVSDISFELLGRIIHLYLLNDFIYSAWKVG